MIKENRVIIYGSFWDSYLYKNNLIILDNTMALRSYKWDEIVLSRNTDERDILAYRCAFFQSDYLYGFAAHDLFSDLEIKAVIEQKFNRIKDLSFHIDELERFSSTIKPVMMEEFIIDMGAYNNELFYCNSSGVFARKLRSYNENLISSKANKLWDCPAQCLQIGNRGRIALSASSEGLFELNDFYFNPYSEMEAPIEDGRNYKIFKASDEHSSYCSWSFSSLFTGSYADQFKLLGFKTERQDEYKFEEQFKLRFQGKFSEKEIFSDNKSNSLIFSGNEKLYRADGNTIDVVNFYQGNLGTDEVAFQRVGQKEFIIGEEIIEAAVVEFGIIIETRTQLYVLLSTGRIVKIVTKENDEVVRWRVFPRSNCYINQLHVIFNDRIEIISFNEDYFVNQNTKLIGQRYREENRKTKS